jgi:hypothetical protein
MATSHFCWPLTAAPGEGPLVRQPRLRAASAHEPGTAGDRPGETRRQTTRIKFRPDEVRRLHVETSWRWTWRGTNSVGSSRLTFTGGLLRWIMRLELHEREPFRVGPLPVGSQAADEVAEEG